MKKMKKLIAAVLLCVVALSFTGCVNLKEIKARHAIWKDEAQTTLELSGVTYKKLPENKYFEIWQYDVENVFITSEDVPVLLADRFGTRMSISKDHTILESDWYENDHPVYYCRADLYDDIVKQMEEGISLDLMMYDFWSAEKGENVAYTLTAEQEAAVETVLNTQPILLGTNGYDEDYSVWFYRSSKNYLFRETIGNLCVLNGEYRIIVYNEGEDLCYSVPAELKGQFEQIMKKYKEEYVKTYM